MQIENYNFGSITVDGKKYSADLIILPDRVFPNWWRSKGHQLLPEDLDKVIEVAPQRLIIGTGAYGMMKVPQSTLDFLADNGIEAIALKTADACTRFNESPADVNTAAAFHLTC